MEKIKASVTLIVFSILVFLAVMIPTLIINNQKEEEKAFPEQQDIEVTEKVINNTDTYKKTRHDLEADPYFVKFALSPDYNYKNIKYATDATTGTRYSYIEDGYLGNMITNFIYNFQLTNTKYLSSIDYNDGVFCMTPIRVKEALEELYYAEISLNEFIQYMPGYIDFVSKRNNDYCFNFDKVARMNDNEILVGIKSLSVSDQKIITADVYIYEFYSSGSDKELSALRITKNYISQSNYSGASDVVNNNLNGKVSHKKIVFRINKSRKYFEYQLLYKANIN